MRPGQTVNTPEGPGVTLHPEIPGHPEKDWWVMFGRTAKRFECAELGEPRELGVDVGVDVGVGKDKTIGVYVRHV